jgi:flagellar basal body-associated protein FliL
VAKLGPFIGCLIAVIICILLFICLVVVAVIVGVVIYKKYIKNRGGSKRSNSTEPMKPQPGEEYADPQKVRENKESGKQGGITYAALEFSEQAGSTGGPNVRSKEQPVQYMAVEHA